MNLIDKVKQGFKEAHHDRKIIMNELHKTIKRADYYEKKNLKEEEIIIEIQYPIQIVSRVMGKDYWHIGENEPK